MPPVCQKTCRSLRLKAALTPVACYMCITPCTCLHVQGQRSPACGDAADYPPRRPSQGRRPTWWRRLRLKARPLRRWATVVGLGVLGFWAASATVAALHNGRALAASRMELERHQADTTQVIAHLANTLHRVNRRGRRHRTWSCEASA